jgi:predicted acylesterase/phospholipase RssA
MKVKINVVCLSGGGSRGAFQVGALKALSHKFNIRIDGLVGVSTGALQAGFMSLAGNDINEQIKYASMLEDIWRDIKSDKDIYKKPKFGYLGLAYRFLRKKQSLYSFGPLKKLLERHINKYDKPKLPVLLGIVDLFSGRFHPVMPKTRSELISNMVTSSSIPFFFPPVMSCVDGGVREIAPVSTACDLVRKLLKEKRINPIECEPHVYVILASNLDIEPTGGWKHTSMLDIGKRALEILENENYVWDIKHAYIMNEVIREAKKYNVYNDLKHLKDKLFINLHVIAPIDDTMRYSTLHFDSYLIDRAIDYGFRRTIAVLETT